MKRFCIAITSATALLFGTPYAAAEDLVSTASNSGSFKTFLSAAKAAGITEQLKQSGPYTIFAPGDSAFNKLPRETVVALFKDKERLAEVLSHHIIPGKVTVSNVKPGKVATLQGDEITLTSDNGKVTVDHANVIQSDLMADNGVIHEIDVVVLPEE